MYTQDFKPIKKASGRYFNNIQTAGGMDENWLQIKAYETPKNYNFAFIGLDTRGKEIVKGSFSISKKDADFDVKKALRFLLDNSKTMLKKSLAGLF
jgi:hypothetical protein